MRILRDLHVTAPPPALLTSASRLTSSCAPQRRSWTVPPPVLPRRVGRSQGMPATGVRVPDWAACKVVVRQVLLQANDRSPVQLLSKINRRWTGHPTQRSPQSGRCTVVFGFFRLGFTVLVYWCLYVHVYQYSIVLVGIGHL